MNIPEDRAECGRLRKHLTPLATAAYDRELARELAVVESEMRRWRAGEITSLDVSEAIHRFHQGPARESTESGTSHHE